MQLIQTIGALITWPFLVTHVLLACIVLLSEILVRHKKLEGENARKFIHIIGGTLIGVSTFFLNSTQLLLLCVTLTIGVIILESLLNLISSFRAVKRFTLGHYVYMIGVGLVLLLFNQRGLFMVAMLTMSLADGMAALVGQRFVGQKKWRYKVAGGYKTFIGSAVFFCITLGVFLLYLFASSTHYFGQPTVQFSAAHIAWIIVFSGLVTLSEAVVGYGLDNITVPLLSASLLTLL